MRFGLAMVALLLTHSAARANAQAAPRGASQGGASALLSAEEILLWPGDAPGSQGLTLTETITERSQDPARHDRIFTGVLRPSLRVLRPAKPNGAAVIVVPGGAYQRVVIDKEGGDTAEWLNRLGVTAFVLKYRLPGEGHARPAEVPLQDGQRAVRVVRSRAQALGIDPRRIGVIGYSAGGHLAGTLLAYSGTSVYDAVDDADQQSARPDFVVLAYAAIGLSAPASAPAVTSPRQLPVAQYPVETGITSDSPPTFLFHAADDASVPAEGSLRVFRALRAAGVGAELHVFRHGGHGFGIKGASGPVSQWPALCGEWMRDLGMLKTP